MGIENVLGMIFLTSQMFEKGIKLGLKIRFALMVGFILVEG